MARVRSDLPAGVRDSRRRLAQVAWTYLLAVLVSGLVARAGASALSVGGGAMAVPWLIAGLGGASGGITITGAALYARGGFRCPTVDRGRLARAVLLAWLGRLLMLGVAVGAAITAVLLAPAGVDRGLAIGVNLGLAGLLALFSLLANDVARTVAPARSAGGVAGAA